MWCLLQHYAWMCIYIYIRPSLLNLATPTSTWYNCDLNIFSYLSIIKKYIFCMGLYSAAWEIYAIPLFYILFCWNPNRCIHIYIQPSIANLLIPTSTMQTCAGETIMLCHKLNELHANMDYAIMIPSHSWCTNIVYNHQNVSTNWLCLTLRSLVVNTHGI
jgi:hypothetical protein